MFTGTQKTSGRAQGKCKAFHSAPFLGLAKAGGCVLDSAIETHREAPELAGWLGQVGRKPGGSLEPLRGDLLAFYI